MINKEETRPLMVSIWCMAYNHESYIRQCLEGFVMQKTNFRFEAIVHDDASTDGTASIIREYAEKYPEIIKPIFETENQYSKGDDSLSRIMNIHTYGKYVAICEGDDYWLDPTKLQQQVDFMETHTDYVLTYTNILYDRYGNLERDKLEKYSGDCLRLLIEKGNFIATASVCYRRSADEGRCEFLSSIPFNLLMGDKVHWLYLASKGNFQYFNNIDTAYRILDESASHSKSFEKKISFVDNSEAIAVFVNKKLDVGVPDSYIYKHYAKIKIRVSTQYSKKDCLKTVQKYLSEYPQLFLNPRILYILILKLCFDIGSY